MSTNPKSKLSSTGIDFTRKLHNDTYEFIKPEQFNLHDRAVLITGASKGCGRAAVLSFARAGTSKIAIAARSPMDDLKTEVEAAAEKAGRAKPQILALKLDVAEEKSVQQAATQVKEAFGRLDILINNAGYLEAFVPIAESNPIEWWKTMEVNIKGPYLMSRAFIPLMLESAHGSKTILNLSSIGANAVRAGASSYQISKLAMIRMSEFINAEYAEKGLFSFSIHPGGVPTELAKRMPEAMMAYLTDTPELAADAMVWLTAERRDWLSGRYVSCTWDMEELLAKRKKIEEEDLLKVRLDVGLDH